MKDQDKIQGRLESLDALRGFDMMFIMGLGGLIVSICALFPGGADSWLAGQFEHVKWTGIHFEDTIFAMFLFISGMTFPFSLAKKRSLNMSNGKILLDIIRRGLVLFLLGMIYDGLLDFDFATQRIPSVLGRIGLGWMFAAMLYAFTSRKVQWGTAVAILVGYFLLLLLTLAPDAPAGAGHFSLEGNIVSYVDRALIPNNIYVRGVYDPEGIVSTLPAIVTALLGMFTGRYVKESTDSGEKKTLKVLAFGAILLILGIVWSIWFPVIKKLWTSTFVLTMAGYSAMMFAIFYYIIDVRKHRKLDLFFRVVGLNSITIYMAQRIIDFSGINDFFLKGFAGLFSEAWASLILSLGYFAVCWLFLLFLYRKKVFLKV
jgi:predicted acyltransferase